MAELFDDESWLLGEPKAEDIEVTADMLDYEFVESSKSVDELRAVLSSLRNGEFGRYPDLEKAVRQKLVSLLPEKERKQVAALMSKPSATDVNTERASLQDWLVRADSLSKSDGESKTPNTAPIRAVTQTDLGTATQTAASTETNATIPPTSFAVRKEDDTKIFRKEKLSTKEYFDRWDKFDVDAAIAAVESEDESKQKQVAKDRSKELEKLQERMAELSEAERKFRSAREREKGNEAFKAGDNAEAMACYDKSILLDESNAKSYSNRAAVNVRLENFDRAMADCDNALAIDPTYLKALARRAMCHHKLGRYQEAVADFTTCHELKSDAGYDKLMQRSMEKLQAEVLSKKFHSMVIHEVEGDVGGPDDEEVSSNFDYIEEVYTPGAMSADQEEEKPSKTFSANLKAHFSKGPAAEKRETAAPKPTTSPSKVDETNESAWHKISIVESSDGSSDEEAPTSMRRIDIVEESDSEDEAMQRSMEKLQAEALHSMVIHEVEDGSDDEAESSNFD